MRRLIWLGVGIVIAVIGVIVAWVYLQFSIYQYVYSFKASLDWFAINFYHNYTFAAAGFLALLVINPKMGKSDFWQVVAGLTRIPETSGSAVTVGDSHKLKRWDWALWQFIKWAFAFVFIVTSGGPPLGGSIMNAVMMMIMGLGSWVSVGRVFLLPILPASGTELINLMSTMEIQYWLFVTVLQTLLLVVIVRIILRFVLAALNREVALLGPPTLKMWLTTLLSIAVIILFNIILRAPYWTMDIETPFMYGVLWSLLALSLIGWRYVRSVEEITIFGSQAFSFRNTFRGLRGKTFVVRMGAIALILLIFIQLGVLAFYSLNWNNNYIPYQWTPQTQKQITVTDWAAGLNSITVNSLTSLPTSNSSTILNLVRQWDQQAAATSMTKEIGAYNWMALASSEIVFYDETEYWVAPTSPAFPATDWISTHMIYTHASRMLIINTHNGDEISLADAFNVTTPTLIYYGEEPIDTSSLGGFSNNIYVDVPGYDEISNQSYRFAPDYTLTGWEKALWFMLREGQLGFAFSNYPISMLWNRDIFQRVQSILIPGLMMDPAAYIVTDGENVYYCVQVYIDYPLHSGFSKSPYLRFLGVVLVNVEDGFMKGYKVTDTMEYDRSDFITAFYDNYYTAWSNAPDWLLPQIRYPEQLLGNPSVAGQLDYHFVYHVTDPFVWRSGSEFYERPTTATGSTTVQYIPWAIGNRTYFVGMQLVQFQSSTSQNLAGVYIAYGGDRLGQIYLYQNPSPSNTFIGPTAAENALDTNSMVRTQETLLPNYRIGSYLIYSVGGDLTYFIAVYTNPGTGGVVTQLPFMTAVDPTSGNVGLGSNAVAAFASLTHNVNQTHTSMPLLEGLTSLISGQGYTLINATTLNFPVQILTDTIQLSDVGVNQTLNRIDSFLVTYGPGSSFGNVVYDWTDSAGNFNVGVVKQVPLGYYEVYFVKITF